MAEFVERLRRVSFVLVLIWFALLWVRRCSDAAWIEGEGYRLLFTCFDWIVWVFTTVVCVWSGIMSWRATPRLFWRRMSKVAGKWALMFVTMIAVCVIISFLKPDEMPPQEFFTEGAILYIPAILLLSLWLVARYKHKNWRQ